VGKIYKEYLLIDTMKRGAIELSIGTIVIIVLAMSMLILGLVLVKNIFSTSNDIVDMTDDQLRDRISTIWGEDKKLVAYPTSREIEVKPGEVSGFGIGIKNLGKGSSPPTDFRYEVVVSDEDIERKCGIGASEAEGWIVTGRAESLEIAPGEFTSGKVLIEIPEGSSLCTFRYRINVGAGGNAYASELMDITIKA